MTTWSLIGHLGGLNRCLISKLKEKNHNDQDEENGKEFDEYDISSNNW